MTQMTASLVMTADGRQVVTQGRQVEGTLQRIERTTTNLQRQNQGARQSAAAFAQALGEQERTVESLRLRFEPLRGAQQRVRVETEALRASLQRGDISFHDHRRLLSALNREYRQLSAAQRGMARGAGNVGRAFGSMTRRAGQNQAIIQQTGFQVQDMVVQFQAGTRASIVLGQQLPQLAGAFGALGAALGVPIALGAVAFAPLIDGLFSADAAANEFEGAVERLTSALDQYNQMAALALQDTSELREEYGALAEEIRDLARQAAEASVQLAVRELRGAVDEIGLEVTNAIDAANEASLARARLNDLLARSVQGDNVRSAIRETETLLAILSDGARAAAEELGILPEQAERLGIALQQVTQAQDMEGIAAAALTAADRIEAIRQQAGEIPDELATVLQQLFDIAQSAATAADSAKELADTDVGAGIRGAISASAQLAENLGISLAAAQALQITGGSLFSDLIGDDGQIRPVNELLLGGQDGDFPTVTPSSRGGGGGGGGARSTVSRIEDEIARLRPSYERDIAAAEAWRDEALSNLDATRAGYQEFAADVEAIYQERLAEAYQANLERQTDWVSGVERALLEIEDRTRSHADIVENLLVDGLAAAEDAWVDWVRTGELSLERLVDIAIEQLARLAFQQAIQPAFTGIISAVSGFFGGRSHTGSVVGSSTVSATSSRLASDEQIAVVKAGQTILTPRQLDNAGALISALAQAASKPQQVMVQGGGVVINDMRSGGDIEQRTREDGITEINIMDQVEREMSARATQPGSPLNSTLRRMGVQPQFGSGQL